MLATLLSATLTLSTLQHEEPQRGAVDWFEGGFAEALGAAEQAGELLMVEFWADWCGWCQAHERRNLSDRAVLEALSQFTCLGADLSVDAKNQFVHREAADLMRLFSIQSYPTLLFIRPDGSAEDVLTGFHPPKVLLKELNRILQGKQTVSYFERRLAEEPEQLEWRYKLGMKLAQVGDQAGYERELASIRRLDPKGESLPMRRLHLGRLREELWGCLRDPLLSPDPGALAQFLEQETEPELLSDGWLLMGAVQSELGFQDETLAAYRKAWKHATDEQRAFVGNGIAYAYWGMRESLSLGDKRLALRIALRSNKLLEEEASSDSTRAQFLDTLACCYFMNGKRELARKTIQECLRLDANSSVYASRLREFSQPD